jgi:hypothetical protein
MSGGGKQGQAAAVRTLVRRAPIWVHHSVTAIAHDAGIKKLATNK